MTRFVIVAVTAPERIHLFSMMMMIFTYRHACFFLFGSRRVETVGAPCAKRGFADGTAWGRKDVRRQERGGGRAELELRGGRPLFPGKFGGAGDVVFVIFSHNSKCC